MKTKICKSCGYVGKPIADDKSSFILDAWVWLLCFAISAITGIIPLILLAPAFSVLHLIKFKSMKCPSCGNLDMVGLHSHSGKELLSPHENGPQPWSDNKNWPIPH